MWTEKGAWTFFPIFTRQFVVTFLSITQVSKDDLNFTRSIKKDFEHDSQKFVAF